LDFRLSILSLSSLFLLAALFLSTIKVGPRASLGESRRGRPAYTSRRAGDSRLS